MVFRGALLVLALLARQADCLRTLSLEDVVPPRADFYPTRLSVQWVDENRYVYTESGYGVKSYNAETDTSDTILNEHDLAHLAGHSITTFSNDGKYILLAANRRKVYRYSSIAEYSVLDLNNKSMTKIGQGPIQVVVWGAGKSLAYVQKNNVYYVPDATQPDVRVTLTTEGKPGEVYYGVTDWIYEEEIFNAAEALWFSPSGTYLAVASFNDTNVESASFPYYGNPADINNQYPRMVEFKYPKAGRTNPTAGLHVFKLGDTAGVPWNIPAPVDMVGVDYILGRINWASEKNLMVLWLNRRQSVSVLINCDLQNDKCNIVQERSEPNGWIDISEPFFDSTGNLMIDRQPMFSEDQRFVHVSQFDMTTFEKTDLSPGNSTVTEVLGRNRSGAVYYIVAPEKEAWKRQLWATNGKAQWCVSCKERSCQSTMAQFSPGAVFAVLTCSATNEVPKTFLYSSLDDTFKLIEDNRRVREKLRDYKLPLPLFNIVDMGDDLKAHVKLMLPPDMVADQKYPMIVRVYAGPGTAMVKDSFDLGYATYLSANRSYIMAAIDVRGSSALGVEAEHAVNNALGTLEVTDTLDVIRRLIHLHPFIDAGRVGVWGWSYGGFTTTMMLIQDDQKTIACGAAVAPVTSWLYYDSIYTERYMDTPQNNPHGYQRSDIVLQAEKLRGKRYLLIHGSGDDNVHYQHSMLLAKKLQHADIAFEQMSYTDENHSLMGVSRHFYHTLDHFWTECFA